VRDGGMAQYEEQAQRKSCSAESHDAPCAAEPLQDVI
jgi:hypothetical protein